MTNEEHQKLLEAYGAADTALMIEHLSHYKLSKRKTYDDDYRAILSWVVNWLREQKSKEGQYTRQAAKTALLPNRSPTPEEEAEQDHRMAENQKWMQEFLAQPRRGPETNHTEGETS